MDHAGGYRVLQGVKWAAEGFIWYYTDSGGSCTGLYGTTGSLVGQEGALSGTAGSLVGHVWVYRVLQGV